MEKQWTKKQVASRIDHTILKAPSTRDDVRRLCREAREYGFASVCVNPCFVPLVADELQGASPLTCCVIGFPLGANSSQVKAEETRLAVEQGAEEVDMVINLGAMKAGDYEAVREDIAAVVKASGKAEVKVIIETCYLTDEEKIQACELSKEAGADFVKTSTGFGSGGAAAEDVSLMKKTVGKSMRVKASGGIRTRDDAVAMLEAGADRIGASAGIAIVDACQE